MPRWSSGGTRSAPAHADEGRSERAPVGTFPDLFELRELSVDVAGSAATPILFTRSMASVRTSSIFLASVPFMSQSTRASRNSSAHSWSLAHEVLAQLGGGDLLAQCHSLRKSETSEDENANLMTAILRSA